VQADFVAPSPDLIKKHDGKLFFDNMALNRQQLITVGVKPENIDDSKNDCTICNTKYHSYRRAEDKSLYNTQATIVWLTT
jgi:copper oxidase (laccase) domain-containing protein